MADENKNMIPDKWDKVISLFLLVSNGVLTGMMAQGVGKSWIPYVLAGLLTVASFFGVGLMGRPGK